MNDNDVFIASCINHAMAHEIEWPDAYEHEFMGGMLPSLQGVIGHVDRTLVKIHKPYDDRDHNRWFTVIKKCTTLTTFL